MIATVQFSSHPLPQNFRVKQFPRGQSSKCVCVCRQHLGFGRVRVGAVGSAAGWWNVIVCSGLWWRMCKEAEKEENTIVSGCSYVMGGVRAGRPYDGM